MTQKQFNVEDARKIMTGEMYGRVMTRDGFPVTILVWDLRPTFPLGGIVHLGDNNDYLREWTAKGKADKRPNVTMQCDLVLEIEGDTIPSIVREFDYRGHHYLVVPIEGSDEFSITRDGLKARKVKREVAEQPMQYVEKLFKD